MNPLPLTCQQVCPARALLPLLAWEDVLFPCYPPCKGLRSLLHTHAALNGQGSSVWFTGLRLASGRQGTLFPEPSLASFSLSLHRSGGGDGIQGDWPSSSARCCLPPQPTRTCSGARHMEDLGHHPDYVTSRPDRLLKSSSAQLSLNMFYVLGASLTNLQGGIPSSESYCRMIY